MKKRVVIVFLLALFLPFVAVGAQPFTLDIWVDKGCGGEYYAGDTLVVYWEVAHPGDITFWIEFDGKRQRLDAEPISSGAGQGNREWILKEEYGYGKKSIYAEAVSYFGTDSAQCEFYILEKEADIEVTVKDQDGEPISGVNVLLNSTSVASTDSSGVYTIEDVGFGDHTVTVAFEGEEKTSPIHVESTQKQGLYFTFTVEKMGFIQVRIFDQEGNPIRDAEVYIDGVKEDQLSEEGVFTISVPEGDHIVEGRWHDKTVGKSVTVQKNQTSSVDLTIDTSSLMPTLLIVPVILVVIVAVVVVVAIWKKKKRGEEKKKEKEEESQVLICPQCKNRIQEDWDTCPYCKKKLK